MIDGIIHGEAADVQAKNSLSSSAAAACRDVSEVVDFPRYFG
jgi:hypothetical protein